MIYTHVMRGLELHVVLVNSWPRTHGNADKRGQE